MQNKPVYIVLSEKFDSHSPWHYIDFYSRFDKPDLKFGHREDAMYAIFDIEVAKAFAEYLALLTPGKKLYVVNPTMYVESVVNPLRWYQS